MGHPSKAIQSGAAGPAATLPLMLVLASWNSLYLKLALYGTLRFVLRAYKGAAEPLSHEHLHMHPCVRTEACRSQDRRPAPYPPILSAALKRCSRPTARHSAPRVLRPPWTGSSRSGRASGAAKQRPAPPGAPSCARHIAAVSFQAAPTDAHPSWSLCTCGLALAGGTRTTALARGRPHKLAPGRALQGNPHRAHRPAHAHAQPTHKPCTCIRLPELMPFTPTCGPHSCDAGESKHVHAHTACTISAQTSGQRHGGRRRRQGATRRRPRSAPARSPARAAPWPASAARGCA